MKKDGSKKPTIDPIGRERDPRTVERVRSRTPNQMFESFVDEM
jgi:hypothetical protein